MGKTMNTFKKRTSSFIIYPAIALLLLSGCAVPSANQAGSDIPQEPVIENLKISSLPSETVVEITSSSPAPYTAFKLNDPPRVIIDIRGKRGENLSTITKIEDGKVSDILFEEGKTQAMTTRMVASVESSVDYRVSSTDNVIRLSLTPIKEAAGNKGETGQLADSRKSSGEQSEVVISEPRMLLQPGKSQLNQVLGIDFTTLEQGRSRLTITTDKKVQYDLDREGEKGLALKLSEAVIPPVLLRGIDASNFESSIDMVRPEYSPGKKDSLIHIDLKEMVPFHVKQADNALLMDFGRTSIRPVEKQIIPLDLAQTRTMELAAKQDSPAGTTAPVTSASRTTRADGKGFTGEPMYLDFVNADVTHILRLINEVSDDNIIWDPEITGQKVSMILKDVPWDEALELILKNNALAKRYVGDNIIWVTTKAKMKQIEAEEEAEAQRAQEKLEAQMKKQEEKEKKEVEQQPLVTEYLPVDFAKADDIKAHVMLSERGSMSVDTRTNTIIIKDIASVIEEAKKTVKQFDTPVKQIMIEAKIVDATDDLTRELGIKWGQNTSMYRSDSPIAGATVPASAISDLAAGGDQIYGTSFTTNTPTTSLINLGLNFATLTSSGLGAITLDAQLALSETEGKSKTLSAPKVIAQEGTTSVIKSGETIYTDPTENVAQTQRDAALTLEVTPTSISYNDYITLTLDVTDNKNVNANLDTTKEVHTTLIVKSGDTIVVGGILKESESDRVIGVPILKDIPGLGWLFKEKGRNKTKSELLIFLTPTVLN
ncbi:MAG: AMIN domain-containing protein [Deltaproteobacteria bacterium]|nr:AMIN domain-containing protein [Deltaproteobacteria bacterium]